MQNRYFFREKLECLYKNVAKESLEALTELFSNGTNQKHRRIHIQNKWLKKSDTEYKPRAFKKEYKSYPFYHQVHLNGEPIFKDGAEFLEISLEEFCSRVYRYMNTLHLNTLEEQLLSFTHLLTHNQQASGDTYHIMEWEIVYNDNTIEGNRYSLEAFRIEKDKEIRYKGKLSQENRKLLLEFYNDTDHITAIFNTELFNSKTEYIIGVAIGISDLNQKVPVAKKVILSKNSRNNYKELGLTLNETEEICAEENTYALEVEPTELFQKHFIKYTKRIDKLDGFIEQFVRKYTHTVAHKIGHLQLHGLKRFFERLRNNQEFYIYSFHQGLKGILSTLREKHSQELYMIMPIYNDEFLFNHFSKNADEILGMFGEVKSPAKIIFITDSCSRELRMEFSQYLKSLSSIADFEIYFIHKDEIQNKNSSIESSSIEFIYTEKRDFILYKPLRSFKNIYKFSTDNEFIEYLDSIFRHLQSIAIPYAQVKENGKLCTPVSNHPIDGLYLYLFDDQQFLPLQLQLYNNSDIEVLNHNKFFAHGKLIRHQDQTIILIEKNDIFKSTILLFDNSELTKDAFWGYTTTKSVIKDETAFGITICSRTIIDSEELEKILAQEQMQSNSQEIEKRLNEYLSVTREH